MWKKSKPTHAAVSASTQKHQNDTEIWLTADGMHKVQVSYYPPNHILTIQKCSCCMIFTSPAKLHNLFKTFLTALTGDFSSERG